MPAIAGARQTAFNPRARAIPSPPACARRPKPLHASDEFLAHRFRLELEQDERREHGFAHCVGERFELLLRLSRESELTQARARVSPRPG